LPKNRFIKLQLQISIRRPFFVVLWLIVTNNTQQVLPFKSGPETATRSVVIIEFPRKTGD